MDDMDIAQAQTIMGMEKALQERRKARLTPTAPVTSRACSMCGEPIPARRLEVNPGATCCVDCLSSIEKN